MAPENANRSLLAQRCDPQGTAESQRGFGAVKDWSWSMLALMPLAQRLDCARLYALMLSAGIPHPPGFMAEVDIVDRQWALAVGSIQPLPRSLEWSLLTDTDSSLLGFAELGAWIQEEFPSLWDRLMAEFEPSASQALHRLMQSASSPAPSGAGMRQRVKRCWALAKHRTESRHGIHSRTVSTS